MTGSPTRPAVRYWGSKWRLARWIIGHFPGHELYCEPFGGSAAVLLQKPRAYLEVYNDLDGDVVNFFRVLRERDGELVRAIELTPFARAEWQQAQEPAADPLEQARRFYIRAYLGIAGATAQWSTGFRRQKVLSRGQNGNKAMTPAAVSFADVGHLHQIAGRLRGVTIENDTALAVIERYDSAETLFYVDPPYVFKTRSRWREHAYRHEMTDDDHRDLAAALRRLDSAVVISGYRCELYEELFGGWQRFDRETRVNGPGYAVESLWLSPRAFARWQHKDLPLFGNGHR